MAEKGIIDIIRNFLVTGTTLEKTGKIIAILIIWLVIGFKGRRDPVMALTIGAIFGFLIFWFLYSFWVGFVGGLSGALFVFIGIYFAGLLGAR